MRNLFSALYKNSMVQFAAVGLVGTLLDITTLDILFTHGINLYIATAGGFLVGVTTSYFLSQRLVFKVNHQQSRYIKYFLITLIGLFYTEIIIAVLYGRLGIDPIISKIIAVILVFFWNYFMSQRWAFREK